MVASVQPLTRSHPRRPHLVLVPPLPDHEIDEGDEESEFGGLSRVWVAVAVVVVFGLLGVVRGVQGGPVATSQGEPSADSRVPVLALAGPGDQIVVAQPGDTLWALAQQLAPGRDPRPVVDALVAANGGSNLEVGQRVLVPAELLDLSD